MNPTIGVLGVQGDVAEHLAMVAGAGAEPRIVKRPSDLDGVHGLILPGGESTTHRKLLEFEGLLDAIVVRHGGGMPVFGTCAGAILLASEVVGASTPHLQLVDIVVRRNAFGRQRDSFVTDLDVPALGETPLRAVFIRAPTIERVGPGVEVLARVGETIVLAESESVLVASFHPELTSDQRLHRRFTEKVCRRRAARIVSPAP